MERRTRVCPRLFVPFVQGTALVPCRADVASHGRQIFTLKLQVPDFYGGAGVEMQTDA